MRSLITALTLLPLVSAAACSVYDTSLLLPGNTGGSNGNSGGSGSGATGSGGVGECVFATYPPAPTNVAASSRELDFTVVMKSIDFGDDPFQSDVEPPRRYRTIGFDLDGNCTSEADKKVHKAGQCRVPDRADGVTDGPGGIDNALGIIIQFVRSQLRSEDDEDQFSSELYSAQLAEGATSVLIRVSGYNGEPNDDQVKVETWVTSPFQRDPQNKDKIPDWKGEDAFPIASTSVVGGNPNAPIFVSPTAYVNDNKIVAALDELGLLLEVGLSKLKPVELELLLTKAFVVCTISPSEYGRGYKLTDCTLAAKWEADHLLKQLSQFPDPIYATAPPLCSKSPSYPGFKRAICEVVDTAKTGNITPATQCDSLSMGVRFQTEPAIRGVIDQRVRKGEQCEVSQGQPSLDSCATFFGTAGGTGSGGAGNTGGAANSGGTTGSGGTGPASGGTSSGGAQGSGGTTGTDAGDAGDGGPNDASVN